MEEESFNKKDWLINYKKLNRDYATEFNSRFKPLILFKKENTGFIDDCNRETTKMDNNLEKLRKNKTKEISDIKGKYYFIYVKF